MKRKPWSDELYEDSMKQALLMVDESLKKLAQEFGINEDELADLRSEFVDDPDAAAPSPYDPDLNDKVKKMISQYLGNPEEISDENTPDPIDEYSSGEIENQPSEFEIWDVD